MYMCIKSFFFAPFTVLGQPKYCYIKTERKQNNDISQLSLHDGENYEFETRETTNWQLTKIKHIEIGNESTNVIVSYVSLQ